MKTKKIMRKSSDKERAEAARLKGILQEARRALNLTQEEFAEKAGISAQRYNRIENDFKMINTYEQEKICEMLYLPKPIIFKE